MHTCMLVIFISIQPFFPIHVCCCCLLFKDAVWITTTNSLCCFSPAEVILSLKSSDFIAHDISRM